MTNAKVHSGLRDDKKLKSTVLNSTRVPISKKKKHRVVRNNKLKRSRLGNSNK